MNIALTLLLCALPISSSAQASTARALQDEFAGIAQAAKPAVVNISTIHEEELQVVSPNYLFGSPEDIFEQLYGAPRARTYKYRTGGVGSGFIMDPAGHVITNDHVVRDATEIKVTLTRASGREETLPGKVIGRDPNLDLAVVRIQAGRGFPFLKLADSDKVRVGEWAMAIGSPFALEQTVTVGVVSAVRQSLSIEGRPYRNLIQTDAAINQGNSGGPLLSLDGEVIGVNTAIFSPSGASAGVGFAIAANEIKLALEYLLAGRQSPVGWLGVEAAPIDELIRRRFRLPTAEGVIVGAVVPGGPAQKADLRRGDAIFELDGRPVESPQDLVARITRLKPGSEVPIGIYRKGAPMTIKVRIGERPAPADPARRPQAPPEAPEEEAPQDQGAAVLSWEGAVFERTPQGVRVASVEPSSPMHGILKPGDWVRGLDSREVATLEDLKAAAAGADLRRGVVFDVVRRGRAMYLSVKS
ncbi:MAG: trypsin-like peptidase domain-containing protein [Elusimicrobia bacterium]|nr:trypsin-like peptidase domain-containing protein [Elusimicrobiota bacterium]